jgi:hypothetical protein
VVEGSEEFCDRCASEATRAEITRMRAALTYIAKEARLNAPPGGTLERLAEVADEALGGK